MGHRCLSSPGAEIAERMLVDHQSLPSMVLRWCTHRLAVDARYTEVAALGLRPSRTCSYLMAAEAEAVFWSPCRRESVLVLIMAVQDLLDGGTSAHNNLRRSRGKLP